MNLQRYRSLCQTMRGGYVHDEQIQLYLFSFVARVSYKVIIRDHINPIIFIALLFILDFLRESLQRKDVGSRTYNQAQQRVRFHTRCA